MRSARTGRVPGGRIREDTTVRAVQLPVSASYCRHISYVAAIASNAVSRCCGGRRVMHPSCRTVMQRLSYWSPLLFATLLSASAESQCTVVRC
jgi:hypothetical protein